MKRTLFAYSFPERQYKEILNKVRPFLDGIDWKQPKWPHFSVAYINGEISEEEKEKIRNQARDRPRFQITGLEILPGGTTPRDYLTIQLDIPQKFLDLFHWFQENYDIFSFPEMKLHVSLLDVPKSQGVLQERLEEIHAAVKPSLYPFSPELLLFFENYEITSISEEFLPEWAASLRNLL